MERDAEDEDQVESEPERGQRVEHVAQEGHALVEQRVAMDRGVDAEQDRQTHPDDEGRGGQDEGRRNTLSDERRDRLAGLDPITEIAVNDAVGAAAERSRQDVQTALIREERLAALLVAIENAEPATKLGEQCADLVAHRRALGNRLKTPALEPGIDHVLGDSLVALELLLGPAR